MVLGLALLAASPMADISPASAQTLPPLACGDTIFVSRTLTADLGPCPNFGIKLGADNITLDLGGHRIFGTPAFYDNAGVYVLGRKGTTVLNGTVTDFDAGVVVEGGAANVVRGIYAHDNIGVQNTRTNGGNTFYGDGIAVMSSTNNRIVQNKVVNNGPFSGIGVYSENDSDHLRATTGVSSGNLIDQNYVSDNVVTRSAVVNFASTEADGIRLEPGSIGNTVSNNQVANNGLDGIAAFARSTDNVITSNKVFGNGRRTSARRGDGIRVFATADRTVVRNNLVRDNGANGIVVGSKSNTIETNRAYNNALLPPLSGTVVNAWDLNDQNVDCDADVWSGNVYHTTRLPCSGAGGTQI